MFVLDAADMIVLSPELDVMVAAARKAGESLLWHFSRPSELHVLEKNPSDFVSEADLRAQDLIRAALSSAYPEYGLVLEETPGEPIESARPTFLVDPLASWAVTLTVGAETNGP